jgi:iron complex outermembrane receptor protein
MDLNNADSSAHRALWVRIVSLFSCRPSVHRTLGLAVLTLGLAASTEGQVAEQAGAKAVQKKPDTVELEKFSVTGSHIRMSTTATDKGALPMELITAAQFQFTAGEKITDFVRSSPVISGVNLTFANTERNNSGTAQGGVNSHGFQESFNMRGFGSAYTLTLVNGRRFGGEGMLPDVSIIPSEAVASVEILKSGASAIYGTDAVAGVVNLKLKDRYEGVEIMGSYGNTTNRDAGVQRYAILFGATQDKFRIIGSANWHDHNGIMKWDRALTSSRDFRPYGGGDLRSSNLAFPQRIYMGTTINAGGLVIDGARFQPGYTSMNPADFVPVTLDSQKVSTNEPATLPPFKSFGAHWLAEYDLLGKRMTLFASGFYEKRKIRFQYNITGFNQVTAAANNPFNPFGQLVTVRYIFGPNEVQDLVPRLIITKDAISNAFGLKGDLGDWNYEVAYTRYTQSLLEEDQYQADQAKLQAAVDAGKFNLFGFWSNSFELSKTLLMDRRIRTTYQSLDTLSAHVNGKVLELPAGDLRFAVGAERREALYNENYDEGWRTRRSVWYVEGPALGFSERRRTVEGYFGELNAPLWRSADGTGLVTSADFSAASRYETLGNGSSITVPQGSIRVALLDDSLILRASYGESFRSPGLVSLTTPVTTTNSTVNTFFDPVRGGNFPFTVIQGGNPNLKPEKGENYNLGIIYTPKKLSQLTLKADYWDIRVNDVIVTPNITALYNGLSPVGSITRDANLYPTFDVRVTNGGEVVANGFDLGASYIWNTEGLGRFTFDGTATFTTRFESIFGPTITEYLGNFHPGNGAMPKLRAVVGVNWQKSRWEAAFFLRYKSGMDEVVSGATRHIDSYMTSDIQLAYNFGEVAGRFRGLLRNTRVYIGIENWWDEELSFVNTGGDGWDRESDYRGRYVYAGFRKKL